MTTLQSRGWAIALSLAILIAGLTGVAIMANAETGGPTVTLASTSASSTNAASIPVTVTFSGPVSGFADTDVSVTNGTVADFSGSDASYSFNLNPSAEGSVSVSVPADVASSTATSTPGNQESNTLTFTYDVTAPAITDVSVSSVSSSGATVTWNTSTDATGYVSYGTTVAYGASTTAETTATSTHSATLSGLSASTTYHIQVTAMDAAGNTATSSDSTFATLATAPSISDIAVTDIGTSSATITWTTNVSADGNVSYGLTNSYGASTTMSTSGGTSHSATIMGLSEGTTYHFQVNATSAGGDVSSSDQTFLTLSTASSTPLAVTNTQNVSSTATADNTYEHGFKWILSLTVPDVEDAFRIKFSDLDQTGGDATIAANGNLRVSSLQSSNASTTSSSITATGTGYGGWLYLSGDTSTTTPGRQVDILIEWKIPTGSVNGSYTTTFTAQSWPSAATSTVP